MSPLPFVLLACSLSADPAPGRRADQEALKAFATLVGPWRGVGQPTRSSPKGAWTESGAWAWALTADSAALELSITGGKYLKSARLRPGEAPGQFAMEATLADGGRRVFAGGLGDRGRLVLDAVQPPPADGPARLTLTPLHDTRFLLLLEAKDAETGRHSRLGEVGYTRKGVAFAAGPSFPTCIVTEGRGESTVSHQGKTYYVCCSGCRDLFLADPDGVLAEAEARRKANAKK